MVATHPSDCSINANVLGIVDQWHDAMDDEDADDSITVAKRFGDVPMPVYEGRDLLAELTDEGGLGPVCTGRASARRARGGC